MNIDLHAPDNLTRNKWFEKIAIWNLDDDQKAEIANNIILDVKTGVEYRSSMLLSIVIATLGLLINSTPVVIGAMLIAPIMQPIQAVAFASATGNRKLFFKAIRLLFISIAGGILCAIIMTSLIPFSEVTNEIAARIQPTLLDLFIAAASGVVAFLAFGYQKLAKSLAGVAMAASLVPPLAVIGIGIAFGSRSIGWGSSVLFLTNLIAIIIAGILIFFLFGFHPNAKGGFKTSLINSVSALIMLFLLCIPLASSLVSITNDIIIKNSINSTAKNFFTQIDDRIDLQSIEYEKIKGAKAISMTLKVPQEQLSNINNISKEQLTKQLSENLSSNIELDLTLVPITSVYVEKIKKMSIEEKLQQSSQDFLDTLYRTAYLLNIQHFDYEQEMLVSTMYTEDGFDKSLFKEQYTDYIQQRYPNIKVVIINRQEQGSVEVPISEHQTKVQELENSFSSFFPNSKLQRLDLSDQSTGLNINLWVSTPSSGDVFSEQMGLRKIQLSELYKQDISIQTYKTFLETSSY